MVLARLWLKIILQSLREATKKVILFNGPATKVFPPTPSSLVASFLLDFFFRASRKVFFILSGQALTPLLPLNGRQNHKKNFFAAYLTSVVVCLPDMSCHAGWHLLLHGDDRDVLVLKRKYSVFFGSGSNKLMYKKKQKHQAVFP